MIELRKGMKITLLKYLQYFLYFVFHFLKIFVAIVMLYTDFGLNNWLYLLLKIQVNPHVFKCTKFEPKAAMLAGNFLCKSISVSLPCVQANIHSKILWPATQYPIAQLLHWYLHRSNSTALMRLAPVLPCSTYTATWLKYLRGFSKVTVQLLHKF